MAPPSAACLRRLRKEFKKLEMEPVPNIEAVPLESNILEWHYCITGPVDTPYHGGVYHGKVKFPPEYPYKPPSIFMITPNGRFQVNTRLCLSMSDFHPEEWSCLWSVASILAGLLSFMTDTAPTFGSVVTSEGMKRSLAESSLETNLKNPIFIKLFPQYQQIFEERQAAAAAAAAKSEQGSGTASATSEPCRRAHPWTTIADRFIIALLIIAFAAFVSYIY